MIRLMEVLLHAGTQLAGWRTVQMHSAVLAAFGLTQTTYSLTQLRYDVRKMKAHGLVARDGRSYCYRLTDKGIRVATMFVLFHKRVCGPLANTLFQGRPDKTAACTRQLKRPTIRPMPRFKSSSSCSRRENLREKFSESSG